MSATVRAVVPGGMDDLPAVGGVATDTPEYFCLLTSVGAALEAAAHAAGRPVRLTAMSVGDGNGAVPVPDPAAAALAHEVYRRPIDSLSQDEEDPNICWAHIVIPATEGGFWIREFGVWAEPLEEDGEPVLYAYGNHAPFYKLTSVLGQATTHELSVPIIMSGTADVKIVVSEAGYATREELEALREELLARISAATDLHAAVAGLQEQVARLASRLTACQIGQARTLATPAATPGTPSGADALDPAGESIAPGVTVAPLTIVDAGGRAPRQAALAVLLDEHQPATE